MALQYCYYESLTLLLNSSRQGKAPPLACSKAQQPNLGELVSLDRRLQRQPKSQQPVTELLHGWHYCRRNRAASKQQLKFCLQCCSTTTAARQVAQLKYQKSFPTDKA